MAMSGVSLPIIGEALGHKSLAATKVYARLETSGGTRCDDACGLPTDCITYSVTERPIGKSPSDALRVWVATSDGLFVSPYLPRVVFRRCGNDCTIPSATRKIT